MGKLQEFREKVGASQVKMNQKDIWRSLAAEFLGTFILMLVGCGSITHIEGREPPTLVGAAFAFGLIVATLAQTIGHVSGCHINPAVTIAMLVTGKIHLVKAVLYMLVQCVAAIVGIAVLKALTPGDTSALTFGYAHLADGLTELQGFGVEFMITFVLLFIIFAVTDENRDMKGSAPVAIGLALAALVLYGGPLTGAGMNPARVLGPCVIVGKWENHWLYWIGPFGGAVTAAAVYQGVFRALRSDEVEAAELELQRKAKMERETPKGNGAVPPV